MDLKRKHSGKDLTIFSEMSALAQQYGAVNLSQGFPDYEIDIRLKELLHEAAQKNYNQYAPLAGNPLLIQNLVTFNSGRKNPLQVSENEITITPGATYGIYTALTAILQPGDEVIVLEPCYDSYVPSIEMNGGVPVFVSLDENFEPDWNLLENSISEKTRAIIINSPHNPSGKVWNREIFDQLHDLIRNTEIIIISDEVYDMLVYDDAEFYSCLHHAGLRERTFSIFSFGKMFHITGWKIGYVIAAPKLTGAFRCVHQYLTFCVNSPAQYALAKYIEIFDAAENRLSMQSRRDFFTELLAETPFEITDKAQGSYFQVAGFKNFKPDLSDKEFAVWLTKNAKVAAIPVSAFYHDEKNTGLIRFCFAKKKETVAEAMQNIKNFM